MDDIVYFELNNWSCGRDYPNAEPFITWCGDDMNLYFDDDEFVEKNKLCVVESYIDQSVNWCITATKEWVLANCPKLLSGESYTMKFIIKDPKEGTQEEHSEEYNYNQFLRYPDEDGTVYGRFGDVFLEYSEENIGISFSNPYSS